MQQRAVASAGFAVAAAWLLVAPQQHARAEEAYDPDDIVYATGAVFEPEEDLANKPRTPLFRSFLPHEADLRDLLPAPGEQGWQSSCVGWAVGYAARAYYVSALEGRRLDADAIPSPAYIYDAIRAPAPGATPEARYRRPSIFSRKERWRWPTTPTTSTAADGRMPRSSPRHPGSGSLRGALST